MDLKHGKSRRGARSTRRFDELCAQKASLICRLYALKARMMDLRAIVTRYNYPVEKSHCPLLSQSVAGHAFMMLQIIGPTCLEFLNFFKIKTISIEQLESMAAHHDDAEAMTGDTATDVDGVTASVKQAMEATSLDRQYADMVCLPYMKLQGEIYEAKDAYAAKIVKMMDALELILFACYSVRNGVGMIRQGEKPGEFVLMAFGEARPVDRRTYGEIAPYFVDGEQEEIPIYRIMYDHSLPRLERLGCPELVDLFKLICAQAFEFPFEQYNLEKMPMDFAGILELSKRHD